MNMITSDDKEKWREIRKKSVKPTIVAQLQTIRDGFKHHLQLWYVPFTTTYQVYIEDSAGEMSVFTGPDFDMACRVYNRHFERITAKGEENGA